MRKPEVSIILPTWNRLPLLRRAVDSVLAQTWRDLELVVSTLQQAEHERQLTEQELDSLHEQIDQLQRGGGGRSGYDRGHRRHDDDR